MGFDVAGGRADMAAFAAETDEAAREVVIGQALQEDRLQAAFAASTRAITLAA